ncbi:hypothetical protein Goshw_027386 [Gossypium schwendimanii]|uniref:Uncharacterized protein n=1 Tax=Gossypium schwendimanii TaxID=34291 RepID=A0A7J9NE08_GOSSC|nr:hypothetical protein [Gossypium schwendimanii]
MAHLLLIGQSERCKRIAFALIVWLQMFIAVIWFLVILGVVHSLHAYRPRIRSYIFFIFMQNEIM